MLRISRITVKIVLVLMTKWAVSDNGDRGVADYT